MLWGPATLRGSSLALRVPHPAGQPHDKQALVVRAAASGQAAGGRGGRRAPLSRDVVYFLISGKLVKTIHVTQRFVYDILNVNGAMGFETESGACSQELEDLPEGGQVRLVMPPHHPVTEQAMDTITASEEWKFGAYLRTLAGTENADCVVIPLSTAPFTDYAGQTYVQFHAAFRAGCTLYLGEMQRVLGVAACINLKGKVAKIRGALTDGTSPDLAAELQGITHVKLFVGGEVVGAKLTEQEMCDKAAAAGMSVVLLDGQGLRVVGDIAPAVQL